MPVYARPDQRNKDEQQHPWIVECEVAGCWYKVSDSGTETQAWAKLERHQRGDRCPYDVLKFKQPRTC